MWGGVASHSFPPSFVPSLGREVAKRYCHFLPRAIANKTLSAKADIRTGSAFMIHAANKSHFKLFPISWWKKNPDHQEEIWCWTVGPRGWVEATTEPFVCLKKNHFIYLFMRGTDWEGQRHREREKQAPCGEPDLALNPQTLGSLPEPKADTQPRNHPGIPTTKPFK